MKNLIVGLMVLLGNVAIGAEIIWVQLGVNFSYRDVNVYCHSYGLLESPTYFVAEKYGDRVVSAALKLSTGQPFSSKKQLQFEEEELDGITFYQENDGTWWLENLSLNARQLNWIFFNTSNPSIGGCLPPNKLSTIKPTKVSYLFNVETLAELEEKTPLTKLHTNRFDFSGVTEKGFPYQIRFYLEQQQMGRED